MSRIARPQFSVLSCLLLGSVLSGGCSGGSSYHKSTVDAAIRESLAKEGVDVAVRVVDETVAVHLHAEGTLMQNGDQVGLGDAFEELGTKALTNMHRILLSTDGDIHFYVLLISDPGKPGAYLMLVRYMDDVRQMYANKFDTDEWFSRTVLRVDMIEPHQVTLEQTIPRGISLEGFLSLQMARRVQTTLVKEIKAPDISNVGPCQADFHNGEFTFLLNVLPLTGNQLSDTTLENIFETSSEVIAGVLSNYKFDAYESIRLIHPMTGRDLTLPRTNLEAFL